MAGTQSKLFRSEDLLLEWIAACPKWVMVKPWPFPYRILSAPPDSTGIDRLLISGIMWLEAPKSGY